LATEFTANHDVQTLLQVSVFVQKMDLITVSAYEPCGGGFCARLAFPAASRRHVRRDQAVLRQWRPDGRIAPSVRRLTAILRPGGCLYLSWRVTAGTDQRDAQGRLYTAFEPALVTAALAGATILVDEQATSASSGKTIRRLIVRQRAGGRAVER
jgi:hypothetical protein